MAKLRKQPLDFVPARPDRLSKLFWRQYFAWSIRRQFHTCRISGEEQIHRLASDSLQIPTIFACTHGSWWDAAMTIELSLGQFDLDAFGMMEHKKLHKYRFLSRIGMFSVVREDAQSAMFSLRYAAQLLKNTNRSLWMFPQGELIHQDCPVISCEPGIGIIASLIDDCRIVPVALRYELLREQRATCWIKIGGPLMFNSGVAIREITAAVSEALMSTRNIVRSDAISEDSSMYRTFLKGSMSMEKRFDRFTRR